MTAPANLKDLEQRFVAWAERRPDIRAAIVVGSSAREDHPADEWADLDLGFTTTNPRRYLTSTDWLQQIATPWVAVLDPGGVVQHVLFEGGVDAGFAVIAHGQITWAMRLLPTLRRFPVLWRAVPGGQRMRRDLAEVADYYRRGSRVIVDKDGLAQRFLALLPAAELVAGLPTEANFVDLVQRFWFQAVWTAKHLRRGELWWAKAQGLDGEMKSFLLRMIEWHARSLHGWDYDTWDHGRFLEEWAEPRVIEALRPAFARYDAADAWRALLATMALFRSLAKETAGRLGYPYPAQVDSYLSAWIDAHSPPAAVDG
jgi:aminoglycoside 6-adenylyltransferase